MSHVFKPAGVLLRPSLVLAVLLTATWNCECSAQAVMVDGQPVSAEMMERMKQRARRGGGPMPAATENPAQSPQEENKEEKKDVSKDEKKGDEEGDSIKRPENPAKVPDPRELEVELDENGMVPPFMFVGHGWPDVMQWLATLTGKSLDWQELPKGYLNLSTQRRLTPDETRDLINRHLHARGYTLLVRDGDLFVFKIDKLDPSLIPRVSEEELYDRQPHDFIKIVFQLPDGADVAKLKEDVEKILSPAAKVLPLVASQRMLVRDTVANVRLVSEILNEERIASLEVDNVRTFYLKYARAEKVIDILYVMLGLDPNAQPTQSELQIQQQKMQLLMQIQQSGKDVSRLLNKEGPPVYLVFSRRRNSIIANAPPEQMRMIEQALKSLDVPTTDSMIGMRDGDGDGDAAWDSTSRRLEKYSLVSMDPAVLQMTLEEIGNLNPLTELRADSKTKMLFARATERDHKTIVSMIDELDGTGRGLEIVRLRYKPAEMVAAGIYNLMVGEEEEDDDDNLPYYYYRYNRRSNESSKPNKGFRVYADVESNSLWLWANDAEMKAVNNFLAKLGEVPGDNSPRRTMVEVDSFDPDQVNELLEQIRRAWPVENKLEIVPQPVKKDAQEEDEKLLPEKATSSNGDRSAWHDVNRLSHPELKWAQFSASKTRAAGNDADLVKAEDTPSLEHAEKASPPPIKISVTSDGRLLLSSSDTAALNQVQELIDGLIPSAERFKRYALRYIRAMSMKFILDDLFADEIQDDSQRQTLDWFGRVIDVDKEPQKSFNLTRRARLMFDYEERGNALLVANATPRQLREIERLIEIYDQPMRKIDESLVVRRQTEAIRIRYSRANTIAQALKDTYRDLLSQRDEVFQTGGNEESNRSSTTTQYWSIIRYGGSGDGTPGKLKTEQLPARFDGALAIGVDDIANMIIVSASEEIFDSVVSLIRKLDEEARPQTTVAVHHLSGALDAEKLQKALSDALGQPWLGGSPYTPQQNQPQQESRDQQRREGERRSDGRRDRGRD